MIDASVAVEAVVGMTPALRERLAHGAPLFAPALLDIEVVHSLRRSVRLGMLSGEAGKMATLRLRRLPITRSDHLRLTGRMWELRENLTAYDAAYVALAEWLGAILLTADARLSGAPGLRCATEILPGEARSQLQ